MALYRTPALTAERKTQLKEIDRLRAQLGKRMVPSEQWVRSIRRIAAATAYSSSTQIEGFTTTVERGAELLGGGVASTTDDLAFNGYALAMQHVGVLAVDPQFEWSRRIILDLHFDLCSFQRDKRPGALREGEIHVTGTGGTIAFTGPEAAEIEPLLGELVEHLGDESFSPVIAAAMAHLNLVSIHPFEDGNGRAARVLQSLVLARGGESAPELGSIEEFLATHTLAYYDALASAQRGRFDPSLSADEWIDFCLKAHQVQLAGRIDLLSAAAERWRRIERLVEQRGWPDRVAIALEQSLVGGLTRSGYAREADIAEPTANIDLRRLVDAGYLDRAGGGRSIHYVPAPPLQRLA